MLEKLLNYDLEVKDNGRWLTLTTTISLSAYRKEFPTSELLNNPTTVLHLISIEYCPFGQCEALIPRLGLDDSYVYNISDTNLDSEVFKVKHYVLLHRFFSHVKQHKLSVREHKLFSGSATKLLLWLVQQLMAKHELEKPLYIVLEASGDDMEWLVRKKYPSLGLRPVTTSEFEVQRLIRDEALPMFGRFKVFLQHLLDFSKKEQIGVKYCIQCLEFPLKFKGIKYCSTYCQLS